MDPSQMSMRDVLIYGIMIHAGIGFVLGLVPLVLGFIKGKTKYGILGLVCGTLGGALLGLILSVPSMIFFTWLILRKKSAATASSSTGDDSAVV
jgi:hypothetical protein